MSWEGFSLFCLVLFGVPIMVLVVVLMLAVGLITAVVASVCAVPVGVAWALAAVFRPEIVTGVTGLLASWRPPPPPPRPDHG